MALETIADYGECQLIRIQDKYFITRQVSPDSVPCMNCHGLIEDVPLRIFADDGNKGELTFCFGCAEKLGILGLLSPEGKK